MVSENRYFLLLVDITVSKPVVFLSVSGVTVSENRYCLLLFLMSRCRKIVFFFFFFFFFFFDVTVGKKKKEKKKQQKHVIFSFRF